MRTNWEGRRGKGFTGMRDDTETWTMLSAEAEREWEEAWKRYYDRPTKQPIARTFTYDMTPVDANAQGTVHGGNIVKYMDTGAGHVACEYSAGPAVTVGIDRVSFSKPVAVGETLEPEVRLDRADYTSMVLYVEAYVRDYAADAREKVSEAYFTFVAVDDAGRPRPVPRLSLDSAEARERSRAAKKAKERMEYG